MKSSIPPSAVDDRLLDFLPRARFVSPLAELANRVRSSLAGHKRTGHKRTGKEDRTCVAWPACFGPTILFSTANVTNAKLIAPLEKEK
jgi:hypothetical protein